MDIVHNLIKEFPNTNFQITISLSIYPLPKAIYKIANSKYLIKSLDDIAWLVLLCGQYQTDHLIMMIIIVTIITTMSL